MSIEQRESTRCLPKKATFAALGNGMTMVGQINDICKGGLAFEHVASLDCEKINFNEVDIFLGDRTFFLGDITCMKIYDVPVTMGEVMSAQFTAKRCGVKFGLLTEKQISQLDYFLENHTRELST